jgi:hypothetical protein
MKTQPVADSMKGPYVEENLAEKDSSKAEAQVQSCSGEAWTMEGGSVEGVASEKVVGED